MKRLARQVASIAWPSFLTATVLEVVVFAFVDPQSLQTLDGSALGLSDQSVYSFGFFVFWAIAAMGGVLTSTLVCSAEEVNRRADGL